MLRRFIVLAGMLIRRRVAAQHFAAVLADAQMHPPTADFDALLALEPREVSLGDNGLGRLLVEMLAAHRERPDWLKNCPLP